MNVNNQYDFFKVVKLDEEGRLLISGKDEVSTIKTTENTESAKDSLLFIAQQLEDVKNLLKLILS